MLARLSLLEKGIKSLAPSRSITIYMQKCYFLFFKIKFLSKNMRKSFYYHYFYAFSTSDFLEKHRDLKKHNFTKKDKVATPQKHSFCTIGVWKRGVCKFRLDFNSRESKSMFFLRNTRECRRCIIICMHLAHPIFGKIIKKFKNMKFYKKKRSWHLKNIALAQ